MKTKLKLIFSYWLPVVAWMLFIFYLSSFHKLSISEIRWQDFITRKLAHMTEYAILSGLIYRALGQNNKLTINQRFLLSISCAILYALSDEYHQTLVSGRTGRWFDIGIDSIGVLIGAIVLKYSIIKRVILRAIPTSSRESREAN